MKILPDAITPPHWRRHVACLLIALVLQQMLSAHGGLVFAQPPPPRCVDIELFVQEDCPHSAKARKFLAALQRQRGGLAVQTFEVKKDRAAARRLLELSRQHGEKNPGVPTLAACGELIVGYRDDESTGRRIERLLTIEVFLREGCPHCAEVRRHLPDWQRTYPGFRFITGDVIRDGETRARLAQLVRQYRVRAAGVPALHLCGELVIGFLGPQTVRRVESMLNDATRPCPPARKTSRRDEPAVETVGPSPPLFVWQRPKLMLTALLAAETDEITEPKTDALPAGEPPRTPLSFDFDDLPPPENGPATLRETPPAETESVPESVDVPLFGRLNVRELGLPVFTVLIGLVDGFNPCAMWVLLFLLSLLVNLGDRRKILLIAGTFVVVSGLVYFAFMAAWLSVFKLIGLARPAQIGLGIVAVLIGLLSIKDFFAFRRGPSLSIPEAAKPGLYARVRRILTAESLPAALGGVIVLAALVNTIEMLCTAGLPAIYTQILTMHQLPVWQDYAFLALYIAAYMFDDSLMVGLVVVTLGRRKLQERQGRWLKLLSGLVILVLGVLMIVRPQWLI